jgi:hypothetical protein
MSDGKPFMHKRIGPSFDPTVISPFPFGSPGFIEDLDHTISQNNKARASKLKVENSVGENLYQWSMYKRNFLVQSAFKRD